MCADLVVITYGDLDAVGGVHPQVFQPLGGW